MNNEQSTELTLHIADEFEKMKDKFKLTNKDFESFSLGYTLGAVAGLKSKTK